MSSSVGGDGGDGETESREMTRALITDYTQSFYKLSLSVGACWQKTETCSSGPPFTSVFTFCLHSALCCLCLLPVDSCGDSFTYFKSEIFQCV